MKRSAAKSVQEKRIRDDETKFWMQTLAEQTRLGKIQWSCTNYDPIALFYGIKDDNSDAYLFQTFGAETHLNGRTIQVDMSEQIALRSGIGEITGSISFFGDEGLVEYDYGISYDTVFFDDCNAESIGPQQRKSLHTALADALIPTLAESMAVVSGFAADNISGLNGVDEPLLCFPLAKLGKTLLNEKRSLDFHRMVLDMDFRKKLLAEL